MAILPFLTSTGIIGVWAATARSGPCNPAWASSVI